MKYILIIKKYLLIILKCIKIIILASVIGFMGFYFITGLIYSPEPRENYKTKILEEYEKIPVREGLIFRNEEKFEKRFDTTIIITRNYKSDRNFIENRDRYVEQLYKFYDKELKKLGWEKIRESKDKGQKYARIVYKKNTLSLKLVFDNRDDIFSIFILPYQ